MNNNLVWSAPNGNMPTIKINDYGFQFNSAAIELLNTPKGIRIGFDKENSKIYFKTLNKIKTKKDYKFAEKTKNTTNYIRISNKKFLRYVMYKININLFKETSEYILRKEENNIYYIDLEENIREEKINEFTREKNYEIQRGD